jgi:hypothetical protein
MKGKNKPSWDDIAKLAVLTVLKICLGLIVVLVVMAIGVVKLI